MYIYSIFALALAAYLAPRIVKQSPVHVLGLAWFYLIDSIVNAGYTASFALNWFLVISQHQRNSGSGSAPSAGIGKGAATIGDTAGFTSPKHNVTKVDVGAAPAVGLTQGQEAVAVGHPGSVSFGHGILQPESMTSIMIISMLWVMRGYFVLVVMSYARSVLRHHRMASAPMSLNDNPFSEDKEDGKGWEGALGRAMVAVGRNYWLGVDDDDGWARGLGGKFRRSGELSISVGPLERERRRRSGTGPPLPTPGSLPTPLVTPGTPGTPWSVQNLH